MIAEPSLVTTSGTKATFNSGGKFPIPKPQKDSMPVEWEQYGTQVEFTPRSRRSHVCDCRSISEWPNSTTPTARRSARRRFPVFRYASLDGRGIARRPNADVLRAEQVHVETTESGVPIASSIPYIGSAFKNVKEERNETAMFVLVRPEIVQPANAADNAPATVRQPGDYDVQR